MIIFLNGTSSSGKSSIAEELQKHHETPLLHFGIDTLFDSMPQRFVGQTSEAKHGFFYDMTGGMLQKIEVGPYAHRLLCCTVPVAKQLISCDNQLVIDEILYAGEGRDFLHDYATAFAGERAYFIKVDCELAVLEQREKERANRHDGLARLHFDAVHTHGYDYDFTVDTSHTDAATCARQILDFIDQNPEPTAFEVIRGA
ncbi:MAG: hypothetical protein PVJ92_03160 [Candidatus Dependentiae bacterium]|jgi:chloramphenicol 3-O phosphotransferase